MSRAAAKPSAPVVLFLGDATVVDPLVREFVDACLEGGSASLDFETWRFGERPVSGLADSLRQVGMFSPKRCVWLRGFEDARRSGAAASSAGEASAEEGDDDAGAVGGAAGELLSILEAGLPDSVTLVVSSPGLDARGRLLRWFQKHARVEDRRVRLEPGRRDANKETEQGLRAAIEQRLAALGVSRVEAGVVDEIARRGGPVLGETLQEVDRLVLSLADPLRLEVGQVRSGMRDLSQGWVFDLTKALDARDLAAAERIVAELLQAGEAPLRLVATLGGHCADLLALSPCLERLPQGWMRMRGKEFLEGPASAALPANLRNWRGYFRLKAAANFRPAELRRLHAEIRRLDLALKSSPSDPLLLFSRLLQAVCLPAAAGR